MSIQQRDRCNGATAPQSAQRTLTFPVSRFADARWKRFSLILLSILKTSITVMPVPNVSIGQQRVA